MINFEMYDAWYDRIVGLFLLIEYVVCKYIVN